ncbi:deoxyribonuclease [Testudinid alphaherpesvirus 3]|uniref:Deoxyribonuclease n=1 Tax=Testudinid alphaherpesvirus 3 TaxID=2560801 RepID=A0A0K1R1B5_9ALPH|nr:deoxyribonuclease [Testudinid alphaherpesvirus 3]AIU39283.1 deoxyribonuclease [Testudinid alphaherpesvirus 3]AIU39393.1 deoxyribonuclease [Testudinid alphaherpesvirus 3]AKI81669.1 deoxyribonuclease [Testudinid alphaherpesvirus 3]AKI81772.1 deoxyribonuclease [Testudinid alphaherpesvirus 3]AKV40683.1 UL12 alkaline exonuclease [Testudinid alphaherpesvirus 3]
MDQLDYLNISPKRQKIDHAYAWLDNLDSQLSETEDRMSFPEETNMPLMNCPDKLPPAIMAYSFSRYVSDMLVATSKQDRVRSLAPRYHRLAYLYQLAHRLELEGFYYGVTTNLFKQEVYVPVEHSAIAMEKLSVDEADAVFLAFERDTVLQSSCDLWSLLRKGLLTASAASKFNRDGPKFDLLSIDKQLGNYCVSSVVFGCVNEACARNVTKAYFVPHIEPVQKPCRRSVSPNDIFAHYACGLLIDSYTGTIGASMDMMICGRDASQMVSLPAANSSQRLSIYELKCRAKYNFCPYEDSTVCSTARAMIATPNCKTLKDFLYSIKNPCVVWYDKSKTPAARDSLTTYHPDWKLSTKNYRGTNHATNEERRQLLYNDHLGSTVMVFETRPSSKTIHPVRQPDGAVSFEAPLFVNPKHPNAKQLLVQTFVLGTYYDIGAIDSHLVNFYARERTSEEVGVTFTLKDGLTDERITISPNHSIPVAIIVSRYKVHRDSLNDLKHIGETSWSSALQQRWETVCVETDVVAAVAEPRMSL